MGGGLCCGCTHTHTHNSELCFFVGVCVGVKFLYYIYCLDLMLLHKCCLYVAVNFNVLMFT